jgi:hypothetical protein
MIAKYLALNELILSSCQSFRQLGYGFLPSCGVRCEYSSCTRKLNEIHRGCAGKTRAFRTRCDRALQIRGHWLLKTTRLLFIWLVLRPETDPTISGCDIVLFKRQDTSVLVPFWEHASRARAGGVSLSRRGKPFNTDELLTFDRTSLRLKASRTKNLVKAEGPR